MALTRARASVLVLVGSAAAQDDVPALIRQLGDKESVVRVAAADKLAALGAKAAGAVSALGDRLADPEPAVARAAGLALGKIGKPAHARIRECLAKRPSVIGAVAAVEALGATGAQFVPDLLESFLNCDTNLLLRDSAVKAVNAIGAPAVPHLAKGTKVRAYSSDAAFLLGQMKLLAVPAIPELLSLAADRSELGGCRIEAASALGAIGKPARAAVPKLLALALDAKDDDEPRMAAVAAIGFIGSDDPKVATAIRPLASHENPAFAARAKATLRLLK